MHSIGQWTVLDKRAPTIIKVVIILILIFFGLLMHKRKKYDSDERVQFIQYVILKCRSKESSCLTCLLCTVTTLNVKAVFKNTNRQQSLTDSPAGPFCGSSKISFILIPWSSQSEIWHKANNATTNHPSGAVETLLMKSGFWMKSIRPEKNKADIYFQSSIFWTKSLNPLLTSSTVVIFFYGPMQVIGLTEFYLAICGNQCGGHEWILLLLPEIKSPSQ